MPDPEACTDMTMLRAEIDRIDRALVALMAERARYIDRAAAIKPGARLPARIDARVDQVLANVRGHAQAQGMDADLAESLWRQMIEWSIAREETLMKGPRP